jgi:hypothetical protein
MNVCKARFVRKEGGILYCERKEGHKGMHEKPLMDGSIFKWETKK